MIDKIQRNFLPKKKKRLGQFVKTIYSDNETVGESLQDLYDLWLKLCSTDWQTKCHPELHRWTIDIINNENDITCFEGPEPPPHIESSDV